MKISKVLIGVSIVCAACSSSLETPSGFSFELAKKGDGKKPTPGQLVVFNFKITDSKDSVWASTYDRGFPEFNRINDSTHLAEEDGITQMMRMLSKGDSAVFDVSVVDLFRELVKRPMPPDLDSTRSLHYDISVKDIINQDDFEAYRNKVEADYEAFQQSANAEQLKKDTVAIDEYAKSKGLAVKSLPSGIRYVVTQEGSGPTLEAGQTALVNYSGYLLDGTYFDTSVKDVAMQQGIYDSLREAQLPYQPIQVIIDRTSVIPGWHMALKSMSKGEKATFFIPSSLAYGQRANGPIKKNSILIFDMEVVDIM